MLSNPARQPGVWASKEFHAAALATVRLMRTPWLEPAPHSLCQEGNLSVWQLHAEHHSFSPSTPRLRSVHRSTAAETSRT